MKEIFQYIYYMIYTWNLKMWGKNDGPELNASLGTSMLMALHLLIIYQIAELLIGHRVLLDLPRYVLMIIMGIIIIFNYFIFVYKKKYLRIIKKFENNNKKEKRKKRILSWLLIIVSNLILFLLVFRNI